jgi:hypothetical protein
MLTKPLLLVCVQIPLEITHEMMQNVDILLGRGVQSQSVMQLVQI